MPPGAPCPRRYPDRSMFLKRLVACAALLLSAAGVGAVTLLQVSSSTGAVPTTARSGPSAPPDLPARATTPRSREAGRDRAEERDQAERRGSETDIDWKKSTAVGLPTAGELIDGVRLPAEGRHYFTWDPVRWTASNDAGRLYGTDRLIRMILDIAEAHAGANPGAPRMAVGDLSRRYGGSFDGSYGVLQEFGVGGGTLGHYSHQNGLDVDVYYPRSDGLERGPDSLEDIDLDLSQKLVDRFVAAGAEGVFVGPNTGLTGPTGIVQPLDRHDDHIHVRLPPL